MEIKTLTATVDEVLYLEENGASEKETIEFLKKIKIINLGKIKDQIENIKEAIDNCKKTKVPNKRLEEQKEITIELLNNKLNILSIIKLLKMEGNGEVTITKEMLDNLKFTENEELYLRSLAKIMEPKYMNSYLISLLKNKFNISNKIKITDNEMFNIWWHLAVKLTKTPQTKHKKLRKFVRKNPDKKPWEHMKDFANFSRTM